jgi:uracil-DNA glycosylase
MDRKWQELLASEQRQPYFAQLDQFLAGERAKGKEIFPPADCIYAALELTPFDRVRVVIIGQDPYHGPGQAHGLSFSVRSGVEQPPSLRNIFQEIKRDYGGELPKDGDLSRWASQGVLLLNSVLTVESGQAGSHRNRGWEKLTDQLIRRLSAERQHLVFLLWGAYAIAKRELIDSTKHLILTAPHPSPLSAHRGFIGCGHFSQANAYLCAHGQQPIQWLPLAVERRPDPDHLRPGPRQRTHKSME